MIWRIALLLLLIAVPAMAQPTVVTSSGGITASGTSHGITPMPTGIVSGDLLHLIMAPDNNITSLTTASGWTKLTGCSDYSVGAVKMEQWYKHATGGDTLTITSVGADTIAWTMRRIQNHKPLTAPECVSISNGAGNANPNPPNIMPPGGSANYLWIAGTVFDTTTSNATVSLYPTNFTGDQRNDGAAAETRVASATFSSTASSMDPAVFTLNAADSWYAFTVAVQPNTTTSPPTGFSPSIGSGNSWTQTGGVATPINGYSVIVWATPSGPAQKVYWTVSTLPDEGWTIQVTARFTDNSNRVRFIVTRTPGGGNATAVLDQLVNDIPVWSVGPINLGVPMTLNDKIGLDITAGGAINANYWSANAGWAALCAGGSDWCVVATGQATTNPATSYFGMGAKEPTSATEFGGTISAVSSDSIAPTVPANCVALPLNGNTSVELTCDASTDAVGVLGYREEYCAGAACPNFAPLRDSGALTFVQDGLTPVTLYRFRRCAYDAVQCSAWTTPYEVTTIDAPADKNRGLLGVGK